MQDENVISYAIRCRLVGPKALRTLGAIDTPHARSVLFQVAENSKEMWPPNLPEETTEGEREMAKRFPISLRIVAVKTIVDLGKKVSQQKLLKTIDGIHSENPKIKDQLKQLKKQVTSNE